MRSLVSSNRLRCLSQVALVSLVAGMAGCSSDFTRFDRNLYSALPQSTNQNASNPYPDYVDPTTTASIRSSHPTPLGAVEQQFVSSDHQGYQANASYNNQSTRQALPDYKPAQTYNAPPAYSPAPAYNPARTSSVTRSSLPKPMATYNRTNIDPVRTSAIAPIMRTPTIAPTPAQTTTSALSPTKFEQPAPSGVGGWNAAGGTSVTMRSGETLYNLSKRYGVPVKEIMRANDIKNAGSVQAGQRIVIPTYVYSRSAPVSAPDNNPNTKAASAVRGTLGQANPNNLIVPSKRPQQYSALNTQNAQSVDQTILPSRKVKPWTQDTQENAPDYSIVTGSVSKGADLVGGRYKVVSGDSLSKIAAKYGVRASNLMKANGLTGSNIKIGQMLTIPGVDVSRQAGLNSATNRTNAPKSYVKPTVDKTVTNSVNTQAPQATGFGKLRWPVSGRVVSSFGSSKNGQRNDGIDISVPEGTAVKAAENGVVIYSGGDLENFGNLVLIRHQDGLVTAYAHNKYNSVKKNEQVKRGQIIAASGRTGSATTPVLHFEVRKNSKPVDPKKYLGG